MEGPQPNQRKKLILLICVGLIVLSITGLVMYKFVARRGTENDISAASNKSDSAAIKRGKELSGNNCSGQGSIVLDSAPMRTSELSVIVPYGLMAGGHVTPIDHQYYWGTVQMGQPDMYDVLSPGKGKLVNLSYRDRSNEGKTVKGDYRGVIMYSCTFFSYFDLVTSLDPAITAELPAGWEQGNNPNIYTDIPLTEGQVVGKVGGQSLDFAIWDTTKTLKKLLVATAYDNAEPWKIHTVPPLDYGSEQVKEQILPYYTRTVDPLDGELDYDIDGTASGSWFLSGTNGYAGVSNYSDKAQGTGYWWGHLSLSKDLYDPTSWVFSIGTNESGQPQQYGLIKPAVTPDELTTESGLVKYEYCTWGHNDSQGGWVASKLPSGLVTMQQNQPLGVVLIQLTATRELKVEQFASKTASQVTAFTEKAKTYTRGDEAKMIESNTRTN